MKLALSLSFLLTSVQALACPDLQGTWKCSDQRTYTFTQITLPNNSTDYDMTISDAFSSEKVGFVTDGKTPFEGGNLPVLALCKEQPIGQASFDTLVLVLDSSSKRVLQIIARINDNEIAVSEGANFPGAPLTLKDFTICKK